MRTFVACLTLLVGLSVARAQEQEGKLLDRLLKPNTSIGNSAQNKQFVADRTAVSKQVKAKRFYARDRSLARSFNGQRDFSARQFSSRQYAAKDVAASLSTRSQIAKTRTAYTTRSTSRISEASDADRTVAASEFAGNRPFLDRGKSQKSLSARDTPLTIDQVRDLLNKNK